MYKVLVDGALMCDSRIEELALSNPVVKLEEGKVGSFSFVIPPEHPMINAVKRRKSIIEVVEDDEILFCGICIEVTEDFYKQKTIYCESELTYLNDSIQRPCKYTGTSVRGLLEAYVLNHNSQTDESKHFTVGMVTVEDSNDYISCYTNMESTMACIKADLVDDLGGFLQVRYADGVRYLDYLADSLNTNSQTIKLGKNLIDYTSNIDSTDIATAIIPLGAKLAESSIEGLEERLTIKSVNDGLDYVFDQDAVNSYGWIYKTVVWDDVTTPEALKTKAEKYLAEVQFENVVIEAKALDLHFEDSSIEKFKLSDKNRVASAPHGLNKYFRLTKLTRNLNNPEKDTITLGKDERLSLTAKNSQENAEIKQEIENTSSRITAQAIANTTALIVSAMGGYIVKTNDELLIMDTDNTKTATKVWRWNINGLGYSKNGYAGPYELAITMDGTIVGKFLAAESVTAEKVVLEGLSTKNGLFQILADGSVKMTSADVNGHIHAESVNFHNDTDNIESTFVVQPAYIDISVCDNNYSNPALYTSSVVVGANGLLYLIGRNIEVYEHNMTTWNGSIKFLDTVYNNGGGVAFTSDRNEKHSIEELGDVSDFIYSLKPCKFKYNSGTSDRFHHGLIAQEVKDSMGADDWGLYVKQVDEDGTEHLALRYDELIADLIATAQSQNKRIQQLEGRSDE